MHNLDLGTAFLYWIPAVSILLIMTVFLSLSFLRYRWKKERGRQSQRDYLELDLSTRRPRIAALSCHTHEQHWTELMQSFPVNQMRNMLREYHFEHQHQFETLAEESDRNSVADKRDSETKSLSKDDSPMSHVGERRECDIVSKNFPVCNSHSLIEGQKVIPSWGTNIEENKSRENPYYDQNFTVANERKTHDKRHKKHKKKKLLSFATSRDRKNKECLTELKIPSTSILSPVSLSPVHCNSMEGTTQPAFTVEINNLPNTHEGPVVPHGVHPSHSIHNLDNQHSSVTNQRRGGVWKTPVDEVEIQTQRPKSDPGERWRTSSEETGSRLFWVSTRDVSQTPV